MRATMTIGRRPKRLVADALTYAVLLAVSVVALLPFIWMASTALKTLPQTYRWPPIWIPSPPMWQNFPDALLGPLPFDLFLRNTLFIALAEVTGALLSNSLIAYGFARVRFTGRDVLFLVVLSTMMMPWIVRMIPLFIIFRQLGWVNTFLPLIVPPFFGNPFFIFLLRQFFRSIPEELCDAARIDGANELSIWWRVVLPLSGPALATVAIFSFQGAWNDFMGPLIYLNKRELGTVALGLYQLRGSDAVWWNLVMAASTAITLPMIALFAAFQRYFIQGITLTGIKG